MADREQTAIDITIRACTIAELNDKLRRETFQHMADCADFVQNHCDPLMIAAMKKSLPPSKMIAIAERMAEQILDNPVRVHEVAGKRPVKHEHPKKKTDPSQPE